MEIQNEAHLVKATSLYTRGKRVIREKRWNLDALGILGYLHIVKQNELWVTTCERGSCLQIKSSKKLFETLPSTNICYYSMINPGDISSSRALFAPYQGRPSFRKPYMHLYPVMWGKFDTLSYTNILEYFSNTSSLVHCCLSSVERCCWLSL